MPVFELAGRINRSDYAGCLMASGFIACFLSLLMAGQGLEALSSPAELLCGEHLPLVLSLAILGGAAIWVFAAGTVRRARDADLPVPVAASLLAGIPVAMGMQMGLRSLGAALFLVARVAIIAEAAGLVLMVTMLVMLQDCSLPLPRQRFKNPAPTPTPRPAERGLRSQTQLFPASVRR